MAKIKIGTKVEISHDFNGSAPGHKGHWNNPARCELTVITNGLAHRKTNNKKKSRTDISFS